MFTYLFGEYATKAMAEKYQRMNRANVVPVNVYGLQKIIRLMRETLFRCSKDGVGVLFVEEDARIWSSVWLIIPQPQPAIYTSWLSPAIKRMVGCSRVSDRGLP